MLGVGGRLNVWEGIIGDTSRLLGRKCCNIPPHREQEAASHYVANQGSRE